jgi:hypothetical protein
MVSYEPFGHLQHKLWSKERSGVKLAVKIVCDNLKHACDNLIFSYCNGDYEGWFFHTDLPAFCTQSQGGRMTSCLGHSAWSTLCATKTLNIKIEKKNTTAACRFRTYRNVIPLCLWTIPPMVSVHWEVTGHPFVLLYNSLSPLIIVVKLVRSAMDSSNNLRDSQPVTSSVCNLGRARSSTSGNLSRWKHDRFNIIRAEKAPRAVNDLGRYFNLDEDNWSSQSCIHQYDISAGKVLISRQICKSFNCVSEDILRGKS